MNKDIIEAINKLNKLKELHKKPLILPVTLGALYDLFELKNKLICTLCDLLIIRIDDSSITNSSKIAAMVELADTTGLKPVSQDESEGSSPSGRTK